MKTLFDFTKKFAALLIVVALLLPMIVAFPALADDSPFLLKDSGGEETYYSTLKDAITQINKKPGTYTLYLTKDYDMSQDDTTKALNGNIDLTVCSSGGGGQHTLKNGSDYHFAIKNGVTIRFNNIILDGKFTGAGTGGGGIYAIGDDNSLKSHIILDDGFVLKNCYNVTAAILLNNTDLTINGGEDNKGVKIIENNAISILSAYHANVTIKGGTFQNNRQFLYHQGENLEITGGLFENNGKLSEHYGGNHNFGSAICVELGYLDKVKRNVSIKNATFVGNETDNFGGAIAINLENKNNNTAEIENCTFKENKSYMGGALIIYSYGDYGYAPINISKCSFINNFSERGGGAIHDFKYFNGNNYDSYSATMDPKDYDNLNIDKHTVFSGNKSGRPYSQPPINYEKFSNLNNFVSNSFTGQFHPLMPLERSLLNNYDVNYYYPGFAYVFDANGGSISTDNGSVPALEVRLAPKEEYTIDKNPPVKGSAEFLGWEDEDGNLHKAGEKLPPADRNRVFIAKWKEIIIAPQTGDTSNIALYVVLAAVAVGVFGFIISKSKRKK